MENLIDRLYKLQEKEPDLIIRKINVKKNKSIYIINSIGLTDSANINDFILKNLTYNYKGLENIPTINLKFINESELLYYVLNGFACVIDEDKIGAFEARSTLDRGVTEPTSEPTIRGAKDSFTENYQKNLGLIRRRVKTEKLHLEEMSIGTETKTRIGIFYIEGLCKNELVDKLKNELKIIQNKNLIDSNNLRELLITENKKILPILKSTELPNNAARNLLEGRIVLTIENTPSVLIVPSFFIDFFKTNEDYNVKPLFSSFLRLVRIIAFFLAIFLPAAYIALTNYDQEIIPTSLLINFSLQRASVPFPTIIEVLILLFTFEILHEGDTRIPNNVGSSLSILGALVLGESAVSAGLISPIIVIVVALTSICSLLFVYHDMQGMVRFYRYFVMILACLFGIIGLLTGFLFLLISLCSIKTFGLPYLLPLTPLYKDSTSDSLIRKSSHDIKIEAPYLKEEL